MQIYQFFNIHVSAILDSPFCFQNFEVQIRNQRPQKPPTTNFWQNWSTFWGFCRFFAISNHCASWSKVQLVKGPTPSPNQNRSQRRSNFKISSTPSGTRSIHLYILESSRFSPRYRSRSPLVFEATPNPCPLSGSFRTRSKRVLTFRETHRFITPPPPPTYFSALNVPPVRSIPFHPLLFSPPFLRFSRWMA